MRSESEKALVTPLKHLTDHDRARALSALQQEQ